MFSYSFWADEAYISGIAAQLVRGAISLHDALGSGGVAYQRLYMLIVALSFKALGVSEFAARVPSIIFYFVGACIIFFLVKKLSTLYGGVLSCFLYLFSHLNLAYATQAKPYIMLEAIFLAVILILVHLEKKARHVFLLHGVLILLLVLAYFIQKISLFMGVAYGVYLLVKLKTNRRLLPLLIILFFIGLYFVYQHGWLPLFNHAYQVAKLFGYKYTFISISAALGWGVLYRKQQAVALALLAYALSLLAAVTFIGYIFNIRYILSLFGVVFALFGICWAEVGERLSSSKVLKFTSLQVTGKAIIPIAVIVLLYLTGYKIVRWPQAYYNPNIDKYGDIQIANYKDFYSQLKTRFPHYQSLYIVNDTYDVEYWYMGRNANDYFMKFTSKPHTHEAVWGAVVYGSLTDFKKTMERHPQGLLIMEDWQSFLPDDVKEYAKKNLHLEYRVESLKEAYDDPWPLALYSWGFKKGIIAE